MRGGQRQPEAAGLAAMSGADSSNNSVGGPDGQPSAGCNTEWPAATRWAGLQQGSGQQNQRREGLTGRVGSN